MRGRERARKILCLNETTVSQLVGILLYLVFKDGEILKPKQTRPTMWLHFCLFNKLFGS
jgi:hypothetical protein